MITAAVGIMLAVAFAVLERIIPAERDQPFAHWLRNLVWIPFIVGFLLLNSLLFAPVADFFRTRAGGGILPVFVGPGGGLALQLLFSVVYIFIWDVLQYWMHRAQHAIPVLWETHRFHHDETAVNSSAALRFHPTTFFLTNVFRLPMIVFFGAQAPNAMVDLLLVRAQTFVIHANVRVGFGPATILLAGPQWHRIHHSTLPEHRDRNFANIFPVIDWIFGTYYAPRPGEYPPTGLVGEASDSLAVAFVRPFRVWAGMLRRQGARLAAGLARTLPEN